MTPLVAPVAVLVILAGCTAVAGDAASQPAVAAPTGPIVVELFTSQGCSSCPPADRLLTTLAARGASGDRDLIPLAFHVDYWDDLGWADPFASAAWSARQRRYAEAMATGRVYTPQLVIAGRSHVVGSNRALVAAAIGAATPPALIDAAIEWGETTATVTATAPDTADAWVAIYEDGLATPVTRGENAGERLTNDHVVRRFERVASAGKRGSITVALDPRWARLAAVVIAQDRRLAIVGSRGLPPR